MKSSAKLCRNKILEIKWCNFMLEEGNRLFRAPRASSSWLSEISNEGYSSSSLVSLLWHLIFLTAKHFSYIKKNMEQLVAVGSCFASVHHGEKVPSSFCNALFSMRVLCLGLSSGSFPQGWAITLCPPVALQLKGILPTLSMVQLLLLFDL